MHIFLTARLKVDSLFDAQSTSVNMNSNSLLGKIHKSTNILFTLVGIQEQRKPTRVLVYKY